MLDIVYIFVNLYRYPDFCNYLDPNNSYRNVSMKNCICSFNILTISKISLQNSFKMTSSFIGC